MATGYGSTSALEQVLKMQESLHGPKSVQAGAAAHKLAQSHIEQGAFDRAEVLLRRALQIYSTELGVEHPTSSAVAQDLQNAMSRLNSTEDDADSLEKLTVSSDHIPTFSQADQTLRQPKSEEVVTGIEPMEAATREIYILRKTGKPTIALADALIKLAGIYSEHSMLEEMEPLLKEALEIRETISGSRHLSVSTDLKNLGRLLYFMARYDDAEPYLKRALAIRQAELGQLHPYVADVAEWYAKLLRKTSRPDEAIEKEALVRETRSKFSGGEWELYRTAAAKATEVENYFLAQALWLAALDEAKDYRFDDPRLSLTLESLAEVYWKQLKYDKAEPLCKRLLQIWESVLGGEHADVAVAANNLAMLCERQGKHVEAAILYQQVLTINEKVLGVNHPDIENTRQSWSKARQMAQKQIELKVAKAEGRWNRSGWYRAYQT
ncbi:hypothetical protein BH10CYA1_BH10CYA1_20710 [soil metagenome]